MRDHIHYDDIRGTVTNRQTGVQVALDRGLAKLVGELCGKEKTELWLERLTEMNQRQAAFLKKNPGDIVVYAYLAFVQTVYNEAPSTEELAEATNESPSVTEERLLRLAEMGLIFGGGLIDPSKN